MGAKELAHLALTYRKQRGWTQGQVAAYSGLSQSFISELEHERYETAEPATLQRLADALGAPLREFLEAAGITDAPDRPVAPPRPPPNARYPAGLATLWEHLTPEERAAVEDHARWLWERRTRRRPKKEPMPEPEEADQDTT